MSGNFQDPYAQNLAAPQPNLPNGKVKVSSRQHAAQQFSNLLQNPTYQKSVIDHVPRLFEQGLWVRQEKAEVWRRNWMAYHMSKNSKLKIRESQMNTDYQILSWIFEAIETASVELTDALLPNKEDFFTISPQVENDEIQEFNAKTMDKYMKFKLRESNFLKEFPDFVKQLVICGNSVGRVYIKRYDKEIVSRTRNAGGFESISYDVKTVQTPVFENIDINDFVVYPVNVSLEHSNCVQRMVVPLAEIQKNVYDPQTNPFGYVNVEKVKGDPGLTAQNGTGTGTNRGNKQAINAAAGINDNSVNILDFDQVEILEYWGEIKINDQIFQNVILTVANRSVLLRAQFNPFGCEKPFIFTSYTSIPNQTYSIGLAEQVLGYWQDATTLQNLILENVKLQVNGTYTFTPDTEPLLKPSQIKIRPGGLIPVKSHDSLKLLAQGSDIGNAFQQLQWLKQQFELTTSVSDVVRGGAPRSGGVTAKEIEIRAGAAKKLFVETASHINSTSLVPILRLMYGYLQRYAETQEVATVTGEDVNTIGNIFIPFDDYTVNITGVNSYIIKNTQIDNLVNWTKMVLPTPAAKRINWTNYAKITAKLFGADHAEMLLLPEDVMEKLEELEVVPMLQEAPIPGEELLDQQ